MTHLSRRPYCFGNNDRENSKFEEESFFISGFHKT